MSLKDQIIILSGRMIVDGNHRALAAYLSQSSISYIDLEDLSNILE